ncbi:unnamed protein product, partial [Brassica oleracea var. botrytis]
ERERKKNFVLRKLKTLVPLSLASPSKSSFLIFRHKPPSHAPSESHTRVEHTISFSRHARKQQTGPPPSTNPFFRSFSRGKKIEIRF